MKTYLVGGAVRDALLGLPVKDRDWVVVGGTPQAMLDKGFQPVGRDFPVFLHPQTREEYALARTERKTAKGYHGFAFYADMDVTLEQDLSRRDLTINAMAIASEHFDKLSANGDCAHSERHTAHAKPLDAAAYLIDPYHGQRDIKQKILRHVTLAFREDPVRILRVARFAARFTDFRIAPETLVLMRGMVANGETQALVPERIWQELSRGLMEEKPSRMFEVLRDVGVLAHLLPALNALWGVPQRAEYHPEIDTGIHTMMVLDMAAKLQAPLTVRFACLVHDLGKGTTPKDMLPRHIGHDIRSVQLLTQVCDRWRIPNDCREIAEVTAREHGNIHRSTELNASALLRLLERCDALRRPERFAQVLQACECDARGRLGFESSAYPQAQRLTKALQAALAVPSQPIAEAAARAGKQGAAIGQAISQARMAAIQSAIQATP
ncbi:MAG: multifunctional CCA addition/repair protein [Cytophagales bacterium]|nr:multifunctional CCA addition/repair protein [Cytophagales bacterium]